MGAVQQAMTRAVWPEIVALLLASACTSSRPKTSPPTSEAGAVADAASGSCARVVRAEVGVEGTYAIATRPGYPQTSPVVTLTHLAGPSFLWLPELPGLTMPARELCNAQREGDDLAVTCVDGPGSTHRVSVKRDDLARGFGVDPACVVLEDGIGARDVDAAARAWRDAAGERLSDGGVRVVHFVLEVRPPARGGPLWPRDEPVPRAVLARLRAPALGVSLELGQVDEHVSANDCYARRFDEPRGIGYACSNMGITLAAAYQVGRSVYYRTNAPELRTLPLPPNVQVEFEVKSFEPMQWQ